MCLLGRRVCDLTWQGGLARDRRKRRHHDTDARFEPVGEPEHAAAHGLFGLRPGLAGANRMGRREVLAPVGQRVHRQILMAIDNNGHRFHGVPSWLK